MLIKFLGFIPDITKLIRTLLHYGLLICISVKNLMPFCNACKISLYKLLYVLIITTTFTK